MSYGRLSKRIALFDGTSAQSSDYTSSDVPVADYQQMAISIVSSTASASRYTLQASFDEGFDASIVSRSNVTTITVQGVYTIEPGLRWLRCQRGSQESLCIVTLQTRT